MNGGSGSPSPVFENSTMSSSSAVGSFVTVSAFQSASASIRREIALESGAVEVRLAPSNCVQCGAITAKGGRLTPPEGGSGPEYTLT